MVELCEEEVYGEESVGVQPGAERVCGVVTGSVKMEG